MICRLYGFLRTMRYSCLPLLFSRKYWDWLLYLRSLYSVFIRMRIRQLLLLCYIFLLTFLPVFGISNAHAQDSTATPTLAATPTPTNHPLFVDPTLVPTGNYQCNGLQPAGWMTVTPDPYWLMQCSLCVTPVSSYDWGVNPIGTPVPTTFVTTPTLTPTVNPIWSTVYGYIVVNSVNVLNPWAADTIVSYARTERNNYIGMYFNTNPDGQVYSGDRYTLNIASVVNAHSDPANAGYGTKYIKLVLGDGCQYGDVVYQFVSGSLAGQTFLGGQTLILYQSAQDTTTDLFFQDVVNVTVNGACGNGVDVEYQYQYLNHWGGSRNFSVSSEWNLGEFITAPTPTPVPVTDCSTVQAVGGGGDLGDEFSLPEIGLGWGRCLTLGGWDIGLAWAQQFIPSLPTSWTVPGVEICLVPIEFGSLNIFGLSVDLDLIAAVMAGVLLIRIIRN